MTSKKNRFDEVLGKTLRTFGRLHRTDSFLFTHMGEGKTMHGKRGLGNLKRGKKTGRRLRRAGGEIWTFDRVHVSFGNFLWIRRVPQPTYHRPPPHTGGITNLRKKRGEKWHVHVHVTNTPTHIGTRARTQNHTHFLSL